MQEEEKGREDVRVPFGERSEKIGGPSDWRFPGEGEASYASACHMDYTSLQGHMELSETEVCHHGLDITLIL